MATLQAQGLRSGAGLRANKRTAATGLRPASPALSSPSRARMSTVVMVGGGDDQRKGGGISRDSEPEQYWSSPNEQKGGNPFKDPVAIIGVFAILFPFLFVLVAIATGAIDTSVYR